MKCKGSVKVCNPMLCNPCALMWKGDRPLGSNAMFKKKPRGPKITFDTIERELNQMASCYDRKRLERLARIPQEIQECVNVKQCCKKPPSCVDYFYDQFLTNLEEDMKMKRKIAIMACKSRAMAKKGPCNQPNCPQCKPFCGNPCDQEDCGDAQQNPWQEIVERCRGSPQYESRRKTCQKRPSLCKPKPFCCPKPQCKQSKTPARMSRKQSQSRNMYQGHQLVSKQKKPSCSNKSCCCKKNMERLCGGYPCK